MHLQITFLDQEDTPKPPIDLDTNTVLFGFNGQGKTRILKAIEGISKISKTDSPSDLIRLIDSLNISQLYIDNIDFTKIFSESSEIQKSIDIEFSIFVKKNMIPIIDCISNLRFLASTLEDIPFSPSREIERYARRIEDFIDYTTPTSYRSISRRLSPPSQRIKNTLISSIRFLETTLNNIDFLQEFKFLPYPMIHSSISDGIRSHDYLIRQLTDFEYETLEENPQQISRIKTEKSELKNLLSTKSFKFISPDYSELDKIKNFIEKKISIESRKKFLSAWNGTELNTRNIFKYKFNKASQNLEEISGISISLNENLELEFIKKGDLLEIEKLSSGEKRIACLILNFAFSDENTLLIDEPEISLSLNYQNLLIGSLVDVSPGKKIILATHAPYIFESCENYGFDRVEV